ncbi:MAG: ATP-dependent DNA helicase UvrD2 [Acidimicrobiales bacterium]
MSAPGPPALGRGVIIAGDQPVPGGWEQAAVVVVDGAAVGAPSAVVTALHDAWAARTPVVVRLVVDPAIFREPASYREAPWALEAGFEPWLDRLHFLVWANNYDARGDPSAPLWWWARKAAHLGAVVAAGDEGGDVRLPGGGGQVWIDGGPRGPLSPAEVNGLGVVHRESVELGSLVLMPWAVPPSADLAPDQLAAVGHGAGPARIIAPAGSGKTRVLTERVRHLIRDRGYERQLLLAVAYNKKAQQEMEARTTDIAPRVRTLNALGYRLLAQSRGGAPRLLDEREVRRLIERFVPIRRQRANTDPVGPYLEALGQIRLGLRDPEEVEDWRDDVPGLAQAFDPYRAALAEAGAVDFDEQIYGCLERLLVDGAFRRRAQGECRHLLVDEFQDLTPAHVLMLRLLAVPQLDVFGVGDDDQVIYGHAGADPGFLIDFERLFSGAASHPLEVNYRCPAVVVRQASDLLSYNRRRVAKTIRPGPAAVADPEAVRVVRHPGASGAEALVTVVQEWLACGVDATEVAVLTRVNALLLAPQVALRTAGVPVRRALGPEVLERTGLRAALAYLRIAAAPNGRLAAEDVTEILRRPSRGLPQWFPERIRRRSWWTLDQLGTIASQVPDKEAAKVEWLVADLASLVAEGQRQGATTRSVLAFIKDKVGLGGAMTLLDSSRGGEGSSHLDDLDALEQVAGLHLDPATFDQWLREQLVAGDGGDAELAGVTLSTVHRVKGMEWDRVAVYGVNAGILPHRLAEDVEEERRVLHVAVTRCRQEVVLFSDESRASPMLAELERPAPARTVSSSPADGSVRGGRTAAADRTASADRAAGGLGAAFSAHLGEAVDEGEAATSSARRRRDRQRPAIEGVDPVVEQALRTWRSVRSRKDSVPAYVVLHDATLQAIASARPSTLVALRRIDGIGPAKLELYGEDILGLLADLADSGGGHPDSADVTTSAP